VSKGDLLRLSDVRRVIRLVGDCRDLGADPALWHERMFEGLCRLVGATACAGGEGLWGRPQRPVRPLSAFAAGFEPDQLALYGTYMRQLTPASDPIFRALQPLPGRLVTRTRQELVPDRDWYGAAPWNDYYRPSHLDHQMTSVFQTSAEDAVDVIALHRTTGDRPFTPREQRLLSFVHEEIGRLMGQALVSATEPTPQQVSPRLRQTLAFLIEGDSEKQVANRLGVARATAHEYVKRLYRHFKVRSRGELMAHVIRRIASEHWKAVLALDEEAKQRT